MPTTRRNSGAKLIARLRAMGLELPEGTTVRHTNAGRVQKAAGAWSWYLVDATGRDLSIGGYVAITYLLAYPLFATRAYGGVGHIDVDAYLGLPVDQSRFSLYLVESVDECGKPVRRSST